MLSKPAPGYLNDIFMWLFDEGYRRFVFESPAARLAQQLMASRTVTFLLRPGLRKGTRHRGTDAVASRFDVLANRGYADLFNLVPVDPVTRESSGLEYVRGSHRWDRRFKAVSPDYHPALLASDLEDPPDIDAHRADYQLVNGTWSRVTF